MKLITKPVFDVKSISVGDAVMIVRNSNVPKFSLESDVGSLDVAKNYLVCAVKPLELRLINVDGDYLTLHIGDVAEKRIYVRDLAIKDGGLWEV